jgi:NTP pyrophosphatase (non-canonical NTP hydrolase)
MSDIHSAIADARRGHRIAEWEGVARRLADAAEAFVAPRARDETPPTDAVERMAYWARRVIENDGRLSADSSASLDMAHEELVRAAQSYLDRPIVNVRSDIFGGMQAEVIAWAVVKGWHGPDAPEVRFGEAMALLHSEVSEALEAYRTHGTEDFTKKACEGTRAHLESTVGPTGHVCKPEGVGSEFADILIRLLHYSELFGVDLAAEFERKMAYNHTRAFRHGGRAL